MLEAFGLYLSRTGALITSSPVLGFGSGFSGYKIALVFGIALVLYAATGSPLDGASEPIGYGVLMLREALIGLFLGFLLHLVVLAVRVAGELIGQEMGLQIASQVDPSSGIQTPLVTSIYENFFILAFLALNGHHWMLRALGASFERAPVGELHLASGIAPGLSRMLGEMFQAGVVLAAPVLVFLALTSIVIAILARVVPHLNVLDLGFTLRVVVALVGMVLFAPLLEPGMDKLMAALLSWLDVGVETLGA